MAEILENRFSVSWAFLSLGDIEMVEGHSQTVLKNLRNSLVEKVPLGKPGLFIYDHEDHVGEYREYRYFWVEIDAGMYTSASTSRRVILIGGPEHRAYREVPMSFKELTVALKKEDGGIVYGRYRLHKGFFHNGLEIMLWDSWLE